MSHTLEATFGSCIGGAGGCVSACAGNCMNASMSAIGDLAAYSISADMVAELQVPKIDYLGGRVPFDVVQRCMGDSIDLSSLSFLEGTFRLADISELLKKFSFAYHADCASCCKSQKEKVLSGHQVFSGEVVRLSMVA